jgi:hypothetical protein
VNERHAKEKPVCGMVMTRGERWTCQRGGHVWPLVLHRALLRCRCRCRCTHPVQPDRPTVLDDQVSAGGVKVRHSTPCQGEPSKHSDDVTSECGPHGCAERVRLDGSRQSRYKRRRIRWEKHLHRRWHASTCVVSGVCLRFVKSSVQSRTCADSTQGSTG